MGCDSRGAFGDDIGAISLDIAKQYFENAIAENDDNMYKMYVIVCYADFVYDAGEGIDSAVAVMNRLEPWLDEDIMRLNYYTGLRDLYNEDGNMEQANYYNDLAYELGEEMDGNAAGGGSAEVIKNFCLYRTPLSFANSGGSALPTICANFEATGLSGIVVNAIDLEKLIGDLPVNMGGADSYDNLSINSALSIANGQTYVIRTNGNVAINADIRYASGAYGALETLPKTIIYANNINISCSVKQIDAILIADRTINTCNTTGDADASERSNQLVINGAIIANKLILGRTFGAYVGAYTKIPAEIINYDASIVLWARGKSSGRNYDNLKMVYQHEMAPRY